MANPNLARDGEPYRFKPGQSGNLAGKPKGTKHLSTWIQELMNDEEFEAYLVDARDGYKQYKGAPVKAIVRVAMMKALSGDKPWADWLANNGYGQKLDLTSKGESLSKTESLTDKELHERIEAYLKRTKS